MVTGHALFEEIGQHLLFDQKPSLYLSELSSALNEYPFTLLGRLRDTQQSPQHHPEGSVWNHTLLVVDEAAAVKEKSSNPRAFMWASLLHDIGKPATTVHRKNKITSYDHDKLGAQLAKEFLSIFTKETGFIERVVGLVRYHMQILFVIRNLPFAEVAQMKREIDIREVALLGLCDRLGRKGSNREHEQENIRIFLEKCNVQSGETIEL